VVHSFIEGGQGGVAELVGHSVEHGEVRNGEGKRRPRARVSVSSGRRHRE
jgi:hypothetical protein